MTGGATSGRRRPAARLLFELVIVFVGVFLAFLATSWNDRRVERTRALKTLRILHQELDDFVTYSPVPVAAMSEAIERFRRDSAGGGRPAPAYYREPRASRAPTAAWQAAVTSGAYELLDADLFYELTLYYNRIDSLNDKFGHYTRRTEGLILPELGGDGSSFYDEGELRGTYRVLIELLEEVKLEIETLMADAAVLKGKLENELSPLDR
jgi:hypothetical protein